jgi:transcriptional regulator with XRE-family HTH domain
MNFAEVLQRLRESAGLTQAGLAEKAGLSLRTVQSWEQGRRSPVSPDFFKLIQALGVDCREFAEAPAPEPVPTKSGKKSKEPVGVGVIRAHEALNHLTRIPKNDALRKRGFQIVTDWIRHNP